MEFMDEQSRFESGCIARELQQALGNISFLGLVLLETNDNE